MRREIAGCERQRAGRVGDAAAAMHGVRNVLSASLSIPLPMQKTDAMEKNNKFG